MTKLLTPEEFFAAERRMGLTQDNMHYFNMHRKLALWIWETFKPQRVLEIGCGPGALLESLLEMGIAAGGIDPCAPARDYFLKRNPQWANEYRLTWPDENIITLADVLVSIEVFEHLTDAQIIEAIERVNFKHLVFSSTSRFKNTEFERQWGHINVKQPHEWDAFFKPLGLKRTAHRPGITPWSCVYEKSI